MKNDRLRKDRDEIHNLDDTIDAHKGQTSHFAGDVDSLESDIDLPDDIDVDDALTFPHPHHKKTGVEDIDLMDTPHKEQMEDDQEEWDHQEFLPSDYEQGYDELITTHATDNMDEVAEEEIHNISHVTFGEVSAEPVTEQMPKNFTPDEETEEQERKAG